MNPAMAARTMYDGVLQPMMTFRPLHLSTHCDEVYITRYDFPFTGDKDSLRQIETPFMTTQGYRDYFAVVEIKNLPDLNGWRRINVRDPRLIGIVPNAIRESAQTNPPPLFQPRIDSGLDTAEAAAPPMPSLSVPSRLRVEGDLARLQLLTPLRLPPQTNSDLLRSQPEIRRALRIR